MQEQADGSPGILEKFLLLQNYYNNVLTNAFIIHKNSAPPVCERDRKCGCNVRESLTDTAPALTHCQNQMTVFMSPEEYFYIRCRRLASRFPAFHIAQSVPSCEPTNSSEFSIISLLLAFHCFCLYRIINPWLDNYTSVLVCGWWKLVPGLEELLINLNKPGCVLLLVDCHSRITLELLRVRKAGVPWKTKFALLVFTVCYMWFKVLYSKLS